MFSRTDRTRIVRIEFMSKMAAFFKINCCLFPQLSHMWREYLPNIPGTDVQYIRCLQLLGRTWYEGDTGQYPASFVFKRSLVNARTQSWSISSKQCLFPRAVFLINMNIGDSEVNNPKHKRCPNINNWLWKKCHLCNYFIQMLLKPFYCAIYIFKKSQKENDIMNSYLSLTQLQQLSTQHQPWFI